MKYCIKCASKNDEYICNLCREEDIYKLVLDIKEKYINKCKEDKFLNNDISQDLYNNIIEDIIKNERSPLKELYEIKSYPNKLYQIPTNQRATFEVNYSDLMESMEVSNEDKNILTIMLLDMYYRTHKYFEADEIYEYLKEFNFIDYKILIVLIDYCVITRKYTEARKYVDEALKICEDESTVENVMKKLEDCNKRETGIKKEYMPASLENRAKYEQFIESKGEKMMNEIKEVKKEVKNVKVVESKVIEHTNTKFNTFIAFDLETTGFAGDDEITEIGAVKVVDGKIVGEFQELVNPKRKLSKIIVNVTGITDDMLKNARTIEEVFIDFKEFIGDDILLGYNCISFDSRFIISAAKKCNVTIDNQYFDVLKHVRNIKNRLGISKTTLGVVSDYLQIQNPCAHRALADAITTAKVHLELKKRKLI